MEHSTASTLILQTQQQTCCLTSVLQRKIQQSLTTTSSVLPSGSSLASPTTDCDYCLRFPGVSRQELQGISASLSRSPTVHGSPSHKLSLIYRSSTTRYG